MHLSREFSGREPRRRDLFGLHNIRRARFMAVVHITRDLDVDAHYPADLVW